MIIPRKPLGQHFLSDENVARKIVRALHAKPDELILEVGPGGGSLTKHLLETGADVVAVEIDPRAVEALRERFGSDVVIRQEDFLETDLSELSQHYRRKIRVVGNIPYYITSEILFRLFEYRGSVHSAHLMMQLEVAQRLIAKSGSKSYGILAVATGFYAEPELLFRVSRNSFYPRPDVDSAVTALQFKEVLPACDRMLFHTIVRATFGQRRKTLKNGLRSIGFSEDQLSAAPVDLNDRPENLSVEDFVVLTAGLERYRDSVHSSLSAASA